jgi:hypothetical protein
MHDLQRMQAPSKYPAVLGLDPLDAVVRSETYSIQ